MSCMGGCLCACGALCVVYVRKAAQTRIILTHVITTLVFQVGELKIMVRSKMTAQPDMLLLIHSDAAKSIHNYLCILFDKWEGMVKTREKWEVNEARTKGRK